MCRLTCQAIVLAFTLVVLTPISGRAQVSVAGNLIQNADFSGGAVGFSSQYVQSGDLGPPGHYTVGRNPRDYNGFAPSFTDRSGNGLMLIANGAGAPVTVWEQTVSVAPGTLYEFVGWAADWSNDAFGSPSPSTLLIAINGAVVTTVAVASRDGQWTRFRAQWNSGTASSARLEISDVVTAANGNDFALDDFCMVAAPARCRTLPTLQPPSSGPAFSCIGYACLGSWGQVADAETNQPIHMAIGLASNGWGEFFRSEPSSMLARTVLSQGAPPTLPSSDPDCYSLYTPALGPGPLFARNCGGSITGSMFASAWLGGRLSARAALNVSALENVFARPTSTNTAGFVVHASAMMAEVFNFSEELLRQAGILERVARFTFQVDGEVGSQAMSGAKDQAGFFFRAGGANPCPTPGCSAPWGAWQYGSGPREVVFDLPFRRSSEDGSSRLLAGFHFVAAALMTGDPASSLGTFSGILDASFENTATLARIQLFEGTPEALGLEIPNFSIVADSQEDYNALVVRDTTPPVTIASLSGPEGSNGWYRGATTLTLSASDDRGPVHEIRVSINGAPSFPYTGPLSIPDGEHHVTFFSTDLVGNVEVPTMLTINVDSIAPELAVRDVTFEQQSAAGAIVSYALPSVSDAGSGAGPATCLPASGSLFAAGSTRVSCTASDGAGHIGSASFTVFVARNRITGSAYNLPEGGTYRATLSVNVATWPHSGSVQYYYTRTRMNFASTSVNAVSTGAGSTMIEGTGSVNGIGGFTFLVTIVDASPQAFGILIRRPDGTIYYSAPSQPSSGGAFTASTLP